MVKLDFLLLTAVIMILNAYYSVRAFPINITDEGLTGNHRRHYSKRAYSLDQSDHVHLGVWPKRSGHSTYHILRYCFEDTDSQTKLQPIVQAAIARWAPAIVETALRMQQDPDCPVDSCICETDGAAKDALMISTKGTTPLWTPGIHTTIGYDLDWDFETGRRKDQMGDRGNDDDDQEERIAFGDTDKAPSNSESSNEDVPEKKSAWGHHRMQFAPRNLETGAFNEVSRDWWIVGMTHELGHAIGFWHEQQRPDAAQSVTFHCTKAKGYAAKLAEIGDTKWTISREDRENYVDYAFDEEGMENDIAEFNANGGPHPDKRVARMAIVCRNAFIAMHVDYSPAYENLPNDFPAESFHAVYSPDFDFESIMLYSSHDKLAPIGQTPPSEWILTRNDNPDVPLLLGNSDDPKRAGPSLGDAVMVGVMYPLPDEREEWSEGETGGGAHDLSDSGEQNEPRSGNEIKELRDSEQHIDQGKLSKRSEATASTDGAGIDHAVIGTGDLGTLPIVRVVKPGQLTTTVTPAPTGLPPAKVMTTAS